ncbi:hypothetical protein F5884DRAFT_685842 [Xylogone sp. PMI_703]|nr:hypothetical protein F5884DRAFT_685842 [Xylogone sp. PMI_703]
MSLPITLTFAPGGREAIADAINRCVIGLDTADSALFRSAFTEDAIADLNGTVMDGLDIIYSQCYERIAKLDTTHFITNIRVNADGGGCKASAMCSALAQHYRGGKGMEADTTGLLVGSLYWLDLVRDDKDGLWKIKTWKLKSIWSEGDWGVMSGK